MMDNNRESSSPEKKDVRVEAQKGALRYLWRVIGSALKQRATDDQIDGYMASLDPPIENPEKHRIDVQRMRKMPQLSEHELDSLGGINGLRAMFGLEPLPASQLMPAPVDFPYTEAGDAEFFAHRHRDDLRYDHLRERWLQVDPSTGIWVPDDIEHVINLAKESIRARQLDALKLEFPAQRKEAQAWTARGESRSRLSNTIALAQAHPLIADDGKRWDLDPMLLGCLDGVVQLTDGTLRKAAPSERVTMRVSVAYDPAAQCPLWERTLSSIFASDEADESQRVIDFLQRAFGYSVTGDCREECCFFTWGEGGNGKGTIMNTIGLLLGDYRDEMPYSTLEKTVRGGGIPNDVAKLAGKRFVTCSEVNEFTLNEARIKALTGRDPMSARFLHKEYFTFIPVCKIWIATNRKPKIVGQDDGIWRRIYLIPFNNKFEKGDGKINMNLKDELQAELPGILAWIVRGAIAWQKEGLNAPVTVTNATEDYKRESDVLTPFLQSCMVQGPNTRVRVGIAWETYRNYCTEFHVPEALRLNATEFQARMSKLFSRDNSKRHSFFLGVGLMDDRQEAAPEPAGLAY